MEGGKFDPRSVIPICLPRSSKFMDNKRKAFVVGMGLSRSTEYVNIIIQNVLTYNGRLF